MDDNSIYYVTNDLSYFPENGKTNDSKNDLLFNEEVKKICESIFFLLFLSHSLSRSCSYYRSHSSSESKNWNGNVNRNLARHQKRKFLMLLFFDQPINF